MKRDRSVSPSALKKEEPAKAEPVKSETEAPKEEVTEPVKVEEPATETTPTPVAALPESTEKSAEPTEETPKEEKATETSPASNKRNSMFGNLGRRASKAFKGMQAPKRENTAPKAEKKETETTEPAAATSDKPVVNGENTTEEAKPEEPNSIGDVVPDAIEAGKPQQNQALPTVAASA